MLRLEEIDQALSELYGHEYRKYAMGILASLTEVAKKDVDKCSGYGYLLFLRSIVGDLCRHPNVLNSNSKMLEYLDEAYRQEDAFIAVLDSAFNRFNNMLTNAPEKNITLFCEMMDDTAGPLVLYTMYGWLNLNQKLPVFHEWQMHYVDGAKELLRRYPGVGSNLPDDLKSIITGLKED